ncbi:FtsB family cell division protein [Lysinibacter cavernae]|uniref:Cell division protein FtsB n=1 Tax=Lysinibacter cavernae TaxID=1640652 RepID=A0A7X5QY61_9MICO|nr:septum formation initiator family protein [Lysinibacter cavernae]NIH52140.1 cell division protein FtsB [Lysinibacter cavernae]
MSTRQPFDSAASSENDLPNESSPADHGAAHTTAESASPAESAASGDHAAASESLESPSAGVTTSAETDSDEPFISTATLKGTARRPTTPPVATKKKRRASDDGDFRSWFKGLHFSGFSIIMIGLLALGVFVVSPSLTVYLDQRQQIAALEASVAQKEALLKSATDEEARWQDPAYVRSEARNRLFYVMPGENQLVVINDVEVREQDRVKATVDLQRTETDWVKSLAYSLLTAGTTNDDATTLDPASPDPAQTPQAPQDQAPADTPEGTGD